MKLNDLIQLRSQVRAKAAKALAALERCNAREAELDKEIAAEKAAVEKALEEA